MPYPWSAVCLAVLGGLGLTVTCMPAYLAWARRHGWGQVIREEGPKDHLSKAGTPTMGGLVLILAGLLAGLWNVTSADAWMLRFVFIGCAALGFVDDLSKVLKKRNLGLKARHKLAAQAIIGVLLGAWLVYFKGRTGISLPIVGFVGSAWLVWASALFITAGASNAVNLTDGLDGLAGSTGAAALLGYTAVLAGIGMPELAVCAAGLAGACLGFLWFNSYPARVFMGDTGSLGLGGALAALALLSGTEWLLAIIGGVFVMEALSVIIQVTYFKLTGGKRVFRMSPIHHHFELGGLHEVQVTSRLALMGVMLAICGIICYFGV